MAQQFILPSSQSVKRQDRFGLLDSEEYEVPFWDLLVAILKSESAPVVDISSLIDALETIAVTLRGTTSDLDYGLLREFMARYLAEGSGSGHFFNNVWPVLVELALEMPNLFVEGTLPSFYPGDSGVLKAGFSRKQIACLVVHQFLCSLPPQPWNTESFVDLHPWYTLSSTVHQGAVNAYLTALFTYFERLCQPAGSESSLLGFSTDEWPITFTLQVITNQQADQILDNKAQDAILSSTHIDIIPLAESQTAPPFLGLPDGACIISANKCIGYGPSGTQEELQVGISPEAYPAVLLAPPLSDHQMLICRGAEAMVSIQGYGRDARLGDVLPEPDYTAKDNWQWRNRTMLFMDALELDVLPLEGDSLIPDLYPRSRLSRDMILKAYNGFRGGNYSHVVTGLWGCGTFGGNRYVKCILQWCAAALAGVPELKFVFSTEEQLLFGEELSHFAAEVRQNRVPVAQMVDLLVELKDTIHDVGPQGVFTFVMSRLSR